MNSYRSVFPPGLYILCALFALPPLAHAQFVATISGESSVFSHDIAVDSGGYSYVTGGFTGTADFDPGPGTQELTSVGLRDVFVAKYSPTGDLIWSFQIGGIGAGPGLDDEGLGIDVSSTGSVFVTGYFQGTADFDPGSGTVELTSQGFRDAFMASYSTDGSLIWARGFGGASDDLGQGLTAFNDETIYWTGLFRESGTLTPGGGSSDSLIGDAQEDGYLIRLGAGGELSWMFGYGSSSVDDGLDLELDTSGNVYLLGSFSGDVDFDPSESELVLSSVNRSQDVVLASYTPEGAVRWAIHTGGGQLDQGAGLAVSGDGTSYITGHFVGRSDFDPGEEEEELVSVGARDVFLAQYQADGTFGWVFQLGSGFAEGSDIALDANGNIALSGGFSGTLFPDPGSTASLTSMGEQDILIANYASDGSFRWAGSVGGQLTELGTGLVFGPQSTVYLTGYFEQQIDVDASESVFSLDSEGEFDSFLVRYNPTGSLAVSVEDPFDSPQGDYHLDMYPNPTRSMLTVSLPEFLGGAWDVEVLDVLGREVISVEEIVYSGIRMRVNTNALSAGTYYVRANDGAQVLLQPFVVVK